MTRPGPTALATAALALVFAAGVAAEPKLLANSELEAVSIPREVVRGLAGGGLPWVIANGSMAKVTVDGDVKAVVHGLLLAPGTPFPGTTGPVASVKATVVCADESLADTAPAPLSPEGDTVIRDMVALPAGCEEPIVMVRTLSGAWLARTAG